jgi:hypothetical protein
VINSKCLSDIFKHKEENEMQISFTLELLESSKSKAAHWQRIGIEQVVLQMPSLSSNYTSH